MDIYLNGTDVNATRTERIAKASRRRREDQKEELRHSIVKTAGQLFLAQGYAGFSMRQLAEQIGYSVATLYLYFRDKDDLLFTVVDEGFARFDQALTAAVAQDADPWSQLMRLTEAYVDFGLNNPVYYQLMFLWRVDFLTQARPGEDRTRLDMLRILQRTVQAAMEGGQMRPGDVQAVGDLLWAQMHGIVTLAIGLPDFDPARIKKMLALG